MKRSGRPQLVYSAGYMRPIFLGSGQLRLWQFVNRLIGAKVHAATTVRSLATDTGANPGTVSRDLDALQRLGLAIHDTSWGRRGVRLWRVLSRGGRRGLDPTRRRRALARMGVAELPGQLPLFATDDPRSGSPPTPADGIPPSSVGDPIASGGDERWPDRADRHETFAAKMRRYGIGEWVDERKRRHEEREP